MKKIIIPSLILGTVALLSSCGLYKQYERPSVKTNGLYRDTANLADTLTVKDTTSFGNLPWREVFTDSKLQQLIDSGLKNNTDLLSATITVQQSEAQLQAARLSFWPSFEFAGSGTVGIWNFNKPAYTYSLPIEASWTADLFGRLTNAKRAQQAMLLESKDYQQAVRTKVISDIANCYYTLQMLDRQLEITDSTAVLTKNTWDMMKAQKQYGSTNEASVQSSEANYYSVLASIPELKRQILSTENSLSLLIGQSPRTIDRNKLANESLPRNFSTGIPVQMLNNRPDVHSAEMNLAYCYYNVNQARAAFYPSLTISASAAWTNNAGSAIINPAKILAEAVGSLTQPIFEKGQLRANLKVAQLTQQKAYLTWQYDILSAGSEVSNALALYNSSNQKSALQQKQITSLTKNVEIAEKLFKLGSSTYVEIISAQQSLLSAQLSKVSDDFYKMQAVVNLYYALGGGK